MCCNRFKFSLMKYFIIIQYYIIVDNIMKLYIKLNCNKIRQLLFLT